MDESRRCRSNAPECHYINERGECCSPCLGKIPVPEPVCEEELVEEMAIAAHYAVYQDINGGHGGGTPEDVWSEYEDDQGKMSLRLDMRAALAVVRAQDRREADELRRELADHIEGTEGVRKAIVKAQDELREVRGVLREVLSTPNFGPITVSIGRNARILSALSSDLRARATRAAEVKP